MVAKKIVIRSENLNRKVLALRTITGLQEEFSDGEQQHTLNDLVQSPQLASTYLSKACIKVFDGDKAGRSLCRQLDVLAYAQEFEAQSERMVNELMLIKEEHSAVDR